MTGKQILIVEDEKPIRDMIAFGLRRAGFTVSEAEDCNEARSRIADSRPDLLLVDWMLPDQSGLELTRSIKRNKETQDLPVILLTARAEEQDKIAGLEGGADDYVTKPFSPRELLARIQAVLRRSSPTASGEAIEAGALKLDPVSHRVIVDEQQVGPRVGNARTGLAAVLRLGYGVTRATQPERDHVANRLLVFDDEDLLARHDRSGCAVCHCRRITVANYDNPVTGGRAGRATSSRI